MEAFSLLKYWRGSAAGVNTFSGDAGFSSRSTDSSTAATTTIVTTVSPHFTDSDSDSDSDAEDGPFFDLEFTTVTEDEDGETKARPSAGRNEDENVDIQHSEVEDVGDTDDSDDEDEGELKLTFSPSSATSVDRTDANAPLSPTDDLFFKGRLVPVEHSSSPLTASEANSKFPVSLLKSATKFRVLMLKLKKPKANAQRNPDKSEPKSRRKARNSKEDAQIRAEKKLFTVKFKVEEVKIRSLFTRDSSSKGANSSKFEQKSNTDESNLNSSSPPEDRKFSKETIQKYLKLVKPLYIRVSKRYGDKLGLSGHLSLSGGGHLSPPHFTAEKVETEPPELSEKAAMLSNAKSQKQGNNLPAGLRVLPKNLMKSRSASSAAVAAAPVSSQRRDDSLIQQRDDGIQGAILHCKRSFNSSRDSYYHDLPGTQSYSSSRKEAIAHQWLATHQ